jgi:hypothetical protein
MCDSYLAAIGHGAQTEEIFYYSAFATHRLAIDPNVVKRQEDYIKCLQATGIIVEMFRFKKKKIPCPKCGSNFNRREEKETDVAIGAKLLELLFLDKCDTAMLVTGDTDIVPAVKTAQALFPNKGVGFLLPYKRHNQELADLTPTLNFRIKKETYMRHQFSDPCVLGSEKVKAKPATW